MLELLQRGVAALEHLAQDPIVEIEAGPPICPHCSRFNPEVEVNAEQGRGPLHEFFIHARCLSCQREIYALPLVWSLHTNQDTLTEEIAERSGRNGNGDNDNS